MFKSLEPLVEGTVICGGDSNVAFDEGMDKNRLKGVCLIRLSKQSSQIFCQRLIDIWRKINPTMRDNTHFFYPHNLFARIVHISISAPQSPLVTKSFIRDPAWFDHLAVFILFKFPLGSNSPGHW